MCAEINSVMGQRYYNSHISFYWQSIRRSRLMLPFTKIDTVWSTWIIHSLCLVVDSGSSITGIHTGSSRACYYLKCMKLFAGWSWTLLIWLNCKLSHINTSGLQKEYSEISEWLEYIIFVTPNVYKRNVQRFLGDSSTLLLWHPTINIHWKIVCQKFQLAMNSHWRDMRDITK